MASDIFLKIDGIKGEATDVDHQNEIEVVSWNWGVSLSEVVVREGGIATVGGIPKVGDFVISKQLDKASPDILRACLTAKHIKEVVLTQRRAGAGTLNFLTITLNDVLISRLNDLEPSAASRPTESIVFGYFAKVIYEYVPLKPNGQPDTPVTLKWDVQANKEF